MNKFIDYEHNKDFTTTLSCPHCNKGNLELKKDLHNTNQYENNHTYMHSNYSKNFSIINEYLAAVGGLLKCHRCNDFISFSGEIYGYLNDSNSEYIYSLNIKYLNPPINIISIEKVYPEIIQKLLIESFSLYWNHSSSCINKLRIIVEEILNNLNIKKIYNFNSFISTHNRIEILGQKAEYKEVSEFLLAIKWIGNEGSHSDADLSIEELLETYNILKKALDLIYLKTDEKLKKKVDEINKKKCR